MESFEGAVKLMLFIYALAAAISLITAWVIKHIFTLIRMQRNRAEARKSAKAADAPTQGGAAPKGTA